MTDWTKRFWSKVARGAPEECWNWTAGRHRKIYHGVFYPVHGNRQYAHRLSWILHFGPIQDGLQVLHKCDNPACVNPRHLFLGTQLDNVADMLAKGRGKTAHLAATKLRLKDTEIAAMREDHMRGVGVREIARRYGISGGYASRVLRGLMRPAQQAHFAGPKGGMS